MMGSSLLYLVVQIPAWLGYMHDRSAALAGTILCCGMFVLYSAYSVIYPELQRLQKEMAIKKHLAKFMQGHADKHNLHQIHLNSLLQSPETENSYFRDLFDTIDQNGNGSIEKAEARIFLVGFQKGLIDQTDETATETFERMFGLFDANHDGVVSFEEFKQLMRSLVDDTRKLAIDGTGVEDRYLPTIIEPDEPLLDVSMDEDAGEDEMLGLSTGKIWLRALVNLAVGTMCAHFSCPTAYRLPADFVDSSHTAEFTVQYRITVLRPHG
eukprot:scaffold6198_cov408-Prasinococcus_capsulatus_cf.AAC.8